MTEPIVWGCCDDDAECDDDDSVKCCTCITFFHILCLQPSNAREAVLLRTNSNNWKCPLCCGVKTGRNDDTPVRSGKSQNITSRSKRRMASSSPLQHADPIVTGNEIRVIIREELKSMMDDSLSRMSKTMSNLLNNELKDVKNEVQSLKDSIEFLSAQYEDVMKEYRSAIDAATELKQQNEKTQATMKDLTQQIHILEQNARACNIEIQCLPENRNENLLELVQKLNNAIGINVKEECIFNCTRIAKKNRDSPRPRSVIVQFNSSLTRDKVLAAVTKFNKSKKPCEKLNSSHVGYSGEQKPIYIMEHLSAFNKELHAAARVKAKEKGYLFTWIRNGRIFVRKDVNSEYRFIRNLDSLDNIV